MHISNKQKKYLKGLAHSLKPFVTVGNNGVTDGVMDQVEQNLTANELVKVKIHCDNQEDLTMVVDEIMSRTDACKVQVIGHALVLFKAAKAPQIQLP